MPDGIFTTYLSLPVNWEICVAAQHHDLGLLGLGLHNKRVECRLSMIYCTFEITLLHSMHFDREHSENKNLLIASYFHQMCLENKDRIQLKDF